MMLLAANLVDCSGLSSVQTYYQLQSLLEVAAKKPEEY
jgi:hypothetical protein